MSSPVFDLAVVGGGSGGLTVAAAAAQFGRRVVLFEKAAMGGECLNTGCVPSKALLAAARRAEAMRTAGAFGIAPCEPAVDFARVMDHVHGVIAAIAPHDSQERFERLGVKVVRAAARLVDGRTLMAGGESFGARRIVLATGSRPALPAIPGLAEVPFFTNETLFANRDLPRHLLIIGAGPAGLELAQAFRRLGAAVTVLEAGEPLGRSDPELAAILLEKLRAEGVSILARCAIRAVRREGSAIALETETHGTLAGSHLLVATGRLPNMEDLSLAAAGVTCSPAGITVDACQRTSNPCIYAVGDVAGGPQLTHAAAYQAGIVLRHALFGLPTWTRATMPFAIYTDPELAQIGHTEAEARARFADRVKVLRAPFSANDRARAEGSPDGLVKVIVGPRGRIAGVGIAGTGAGELIQPWVLAMGRGPGLAAMARLVAPYPTLGEASRRAAIGKYADFASNPWVRRVIGVISALRR